MTKTVELFEGHKAALPTALSKFKICGADHGVAKHLAMKTVFSYCLNIG